MSLYKIALNLLYDNRLVKNSQIAQAVKGLEDLRAECS